MEENEFRKRLRDMSNYEPRNYETRVDTFMPHHKKIIVDRPIHPERKMEEQDLREEYKRIYDEVLGEDNTSCELNYETIVDGPVAQRVSRIPQDSPLYPDKFIDEYELSQKFKESYKRKVEEEEEK